MIGINARREKLFTACALILGDRRSSVRARSEGAFILHLWMGLLVIRLEHLVRGGSEVLDYKSTLSLFDRCNSSIEKKLQELWKAVILRTLTLTKKIQRPSSPSAIYASIQLNCGVNTSITFCNRYYHFCKHVLHYSTDEYLMYITILIV